MSNHLFVCPELYQQFYEANKKVEPVYVKMNEFVFILKGDKGCEPGKVTVAGNIRNGLKISPTLDHPILTLYELPKQQFMLASLKNSVTAPTLKPEQHVEIDEETIIKEFRTRFSKHFVGTQQEFYLKINVRFNYFSRLTTLSESRSMSSLSSPRTFTSACCSKRPTWSSSQSPRT